MIDKNVEVNCSNYANDELTGLWIIKTNGLHTQQLAAITRSGSTLYSSGDLMGG